MHVEMGREQFENRGLVSVQEDWMKIWQLSDWKSGLNIYLCKFTKQPIGREI